jgi:hypothetical protein
VLQNKEEKKPQAESGKEQEPLALPWFNAPDKIREKP